MAGRKTTSKLSLSFFVAMIYLFLYVPIIVLIVFSFNGEAFPAPWTGFTFHWYKELWYHSEQLWHAFYNSLLVACCATMLSLAMSMAFIFNVVHGGRMKKLVTMFYANLVVPEIVLAVGLLSIFTLFSIPLGKVTLIMVHTVLGLGYALPLIYTRYEELDYRLIEASLDLGANYKQTFTKVVFPLVRPSMVIAGLLVFIISFDDFVLSYFCAGTTAQTLPLYLLAMLRTGVSPVANALSTGLLLLSSILVFIFSLINAKARILSNE